MQCKHEFPTALALSFLCRSHLMDRRYQQSGLDERITLADFDWRFNPQRPRAACFELHTLKFVA